MGLLVVEAVTVVVVDLISTNWLAVRFQIL